MPVNHPGLGMIHPQNPLIHPLIWTKYPAILTPRTVGPGTTTAASAATALPWFLNREVKNIIFEAGEPVNLTPRSKHGKSLVVPYTLSPFKFSSFFFKCTSLKVKPLAGNLSFA